jgi:hypothetical protein
MEAGQLLGRMLLRFESNAAEIIEDLSAAVLAANGQLWVASDEGGALERLSPAGPRIYAQHESFEVADFIGGLDKGVEIDIEALDVHADYLWVVGSHSSKRKRPKGKTMEKDLARLATVAHEPPRFLLARIPISEGDLSTELKKKGPKKRRLSAAQLKPLDEQEGGKARGKRPKALPGENLLLELLRQDVHFGPFLARSVPDKKGMLSIPSKDNGLDIEGLVVTDTNRVFLGLRGPVLRGHAALIDMRLTATEEGVLEPKPGKKGSRYFKHFLDLDGLGIRELCVHGEDLLVLAGPTLPVEAPIRLFRLRRFLELQGDNLLTQEKGVLEPLFDVPHMGTRDHAEGMANFSYFDEQDSVLIVYDSPAPHRRYGPDGVFADIFRLPE